jgi:hypothetical protein
MENTRTQNPSLDIRPSPELSSAIEEWRRKLPNIPGRAKAARLLIWKGLECYAEPYAQPLPQPEDKPDAG